jgi:hypothetical protein
MRVLLCALLATLSFTAAAVDKTYAVLSLVGDRLLLSFYNPGTGSRLDRNDRQFVNLGNDALDRTALRAVKAAVAKADPQAKVELLSVGKASFYSAANATLDQGGVEALVTVLQPELKGIPASHWILVTKHRAEAQLRIREGTIGSGQLEGLGFYVDRVRTLQDVDTGAMSTGFVSPFAYLRLTLVDAATGKVLKEATSIMTTTAIKQSSTSAWDVLTPEEKVDYLEQLIRRGAADAVPKLLAP